MSGTGGLLGTGCLVNWGGVVAEQEDDYNAWHSLEHMPERLAVPGFRRGRRCVGVTGTAVEQKYFMMYEADTPDVFISEPYLQRLNDPTPWTQRILSAYIAPSRTVCRVVASQGFGAGGWAGTLQFSKLDTIETLRDGACAQMQGVLSRTGILAYHVLEGDRTLGQQPTAEKTFRESRGDEDRTVDLAVMIEALSEHAAETALADAAETLAAHSPEPPIASVYVNQHVLTDADIAK